MGQNRPDYTRPMRHGTVGVGQITKRLNRLGLDEITREKIRQALLGNHQTTRQPKPLKLTGRIKNQILKVLESDGQCGLFVTKKRKIYIASGKSVKIQMFNLQKPDVLKKAMQAIHNNHLQPDVVPAGAAL